MITIQTAGIEQATAALAELTPEFRRKAQKAIRATMRQAKTEAVAKVVQRYTIKKSDVSKTLKTKIVGLSGELVSSGKNNSLNRFRNNPKGRITRRGVYIHHEVIRGKVEVNKRHWRRPEASAILERTGPKRYPIKKAFGPSTPRMLANNLVSRRVLKFMENKFLENFV